MKWVARFDGRRQRRWGRWREETELSFAAVGEESGKQYRVSFTCDLDDGRNFGGGGGADDADGGTSA